MSYMAGMSCKRAWQPDRYQLALPAASRVRCQLISTHRNAIPRLLLRNRASALPPPLNLLSRLQCFCPGCSNVVAHVRNRYPGSLLFAAGWSLGANIMTRYLGG